MRLYDNFATKEGETGGGISIPQPYFERSLSMSTMVCLSLLLPWERAPIIET